ncbi:MAG TPA: UDP-N-acetylmuramoyl-tripeptide--D-alanyl-D-alanine ligase [Blastocatellia bacterium]|nr:UDP-N-acetylmuramoyl-tripeptide--D-alanyl-D-alanine ligase [Blastocatellia bacterium]
MNVAEASRRIGAGDPARAIADTEIAGYSIDSRTTRERDLFFAVTGERHDGHQFAGTALERGAVAVVVGHTVEGIDADRQIVVPDPLRALQELARSVLRAWGGPVVAVTGSAGKTTTKDLTARVLSAAGPTHKSVGNLNNAFGLPKSVLEMETDGRTASQYRYCVLEMGMSTPGEIRRLTELAPPSVGVITIVAPVHTEFFEDGVEGVARAKAELVEGIKPGGSAVLNADDERVARMATLRDDIGVVRFGLDADAEVTARDIEPEGLGGSRFELVTPTGSAPVTLPLVGRHNVMNALAAAGAAVALGLDTGMVADALSNAEPSRMRGQVVRLANGATIIDDSYNSSPRALDAMVATLAAIPAAVRRIVVAGEMLELGSNSAEMHRDAGKAIAAAGIDMLIGVRGDARMMVEGASEAGMGESAVFVETPEAAAELVARTVGAGDVVLVKGSRGVATDRAVAALVERFGAGGS